MRIKFVLGIAVVSLTANAAWNGSATGPVGMIQVTQNGSFSVRFANNATICAAGGDVTVGSVNVGSSVEGSTITAEGARAMLATVTAAKLAGKPVKIYAINGVSGVTWGCQIGWIELP